MGPPQGDLPSSSALRRWPSSPYSSLRKRQQFSLDPAWASLNGHPFLGLLHRDTQDGHQPGLDSLAGSSEQGSQVQIQRQRKEPSLQTTQSASPVPSWGSDAPPAGPAETSAPSRVCAPEATPSWRAPDSRHPSEEAAPTASNETCLAQPLPKRALTNTPPTANERNAS